MYTPWNPVDPIETIFHRLNDAIAYSIAGRDPITEAAAVRAGYDVLEHSGLFPRACETWRTASPDTHTLANLRAIFKVADTDRKRMVTTGSLGYANVLAATPSVLPLLSPDSLSLPFSALLVSTPSTALSEKTYCWTHGSSKVEPGTTQPQITENNRLHKRAVAIHSLYVAVNNALRRQILDAVPRVYVRDLEHPQFAYSHISCRDLLAHLWRNFGTITASDLKSNIQSMYTPWNPVDPIETIFHRLNDAIAYSIAGRDPITEAAAVRAGYDVLEHSGLFPRACETWRTASPDTHTLANLRAIFKVADTDRKRMVTTGSLGYANVLAATPSVLPLLSPDSLSLPFSALLVSTPSTALSEKTYCWTHGSSNNCRHTSATCKNKAPGHRDDATATNTLGGSTKVWTAPKPPE
jgi:hypothetical protein